MKKRVGRLNHRHLLTDLFLIALSAYLSLYLRLGGPEFLQTVGILNKLIPLFLTIRIASIVAFGAYDIIWRYISLNDAWKLEKAVLFSSLSSIAATYLIDTGRIPRSTFFIDTILVSTLLVGIRLGRRLVYDRTSSKALEASGRRTLIYGAGINGRTFAQRLNTDQGLNLKLFGFVDDDPAKVGRFIGGVKVLGTREDLMELIQDYHIRELIVAMSHPPGPLLRELIEILRPFNIRPRLLSSPLGNEHHQEDRHSFELFRNIELNDLLNRPKRTPDLASMKALLENKRVLITGAGGSIGSELARQVLGFGPSRLVLLDHSEFNLYQIDHELRVSGTDNGVVVPVLANIRDKGALSLSIREYLPEIVFHAAAYKHVHLVESNPYTAIMNNIEGTQNLLDVCQEIQVNTFVLISTDKAVNPAGIMGATKRVCELMVSEVARLTGKKYCSVRFGNVLGSSGSLIPLLHKQIQNGEPVTITHKDMTRYFMLIPEAVSLVLKAASIAKPSDICILKMGNPVKIVDIARNLIALMGKRENEVQIVYTGMRPGEKLFEELYLCGNELNTEDPDILVLPKGDQSYDPRGVLTGDDLFEKLHVLIRLAHEGKREAVLQLQALVKASQRPVEVDEESAIATVRVLKPQLTS